MRRERGGEEEDAADILERMRGTVVGVLRGGPSEAHDVSLRTGHSMLTALDPERYTPRDIYIDRTGSWHVAGRPVSPADALRSVDVALVGLHGEFGEDGGVQRILEAAGVPYTGSSAFPSYTAAHKLFAKRKAEELGVLTPKYRYAEAAGLEDTLADVVRSFHPPVVVKPARSGLSLGVSLQGGYAPIHREVTRLLHGGSGGVLIEERISGTEATVGVIESFRGEPLYAMPPMEIAPLEGGLFTHEAKRSGNALFRFPAAFSKLVGDELMRTARRMHEALGLRHYSRSDFIVSPKGVYYLETNALPPLGDEHAFARALGGVGVRLGGFLDHIVGLAARRV